MEENLSLLDDHIISRYCDLCINTAHRLIETIFEHLDTAYKSFGWHSVYCMVTLILSDGFSRD